MVAAAMLPRDVNVDTVEPCHWFRRNRRARRDLGEDIHERFRLPALASPRP